MNIPLPIYYALSVSVSILLVTWIRSKASNFPRERMDRALGFTCIMMMIALAHILLFVTFGEQMKEWGKETFIRWKGREGELVFYLGATSFVIGCFFLFVLGKLIWGALIRRDKVYKMREDFKYDYHY